MQVVAEAQGQQGYALLGNDDATGILEAARGKRAGLGKISGRDTPDVMSDKSDPLLPHPV